MSAASGLAISVKHSVGLLFALWAIGTNAGCFANCVLALIKGQKLNVADGLLARVRPIATLAEAVLGQGLQSLLRRN